MSKFYYKEKVIGSGTFGTVWLVKSKINNSLLVLKEVNLMLMNSTEVQQALTEVTVLSRCRHRNIIKYIDAVIDHKKGILSIAMEYANGGDLYSAIIKQRGVPFKEHVVITWFIQISLALQYIHHKNILHRDLKTRNVFLNRERQIKIGDFGIARCLMETTELATTAIGTPYYLSPEICLRKPYNHKSDIWALGCILFEMAALSHPFQARSFPHLLSLILTGKRKELPRQCNSLIKDLVQLLLDENPETRPSADEILSRPCLQPYLSEVWAIQNSNNSTSMSNMLKRKISVRRHSLCEAVPVNDVSAKRRASISSVESRTIKSRFGSVGKAKNTQSSKLATISRSHSERGCKKFHNTCAAKKNHFLTYRVLKPFTLKERIANTLTNVSKKPQSEENCSRGSNVKYSRRCYESDCGYQSEEPLKSISLKAPDYEEPNSVDLPKTSTKKYIDAPNFQIEESIVNEVFEGRVKQIRENPKFLTNANHVHSECPHSQCQQCMLDMLWKNRIRGTIGPMMKIDERSELIRKLHTVFGYDLFADVYNVLIFNWEGKYDDTPKSLREITNSLNYSQLQHLPLMMQLIQLDLVSMRNK